MTDTKTKPPAEGTPTQVAHPGRATARTVVSYVVAALTFTLAAIPILQEVLGPLTGENVAAWLATAFTWVGAAHAIVTRLMALAGLQDVLEKVRLGTGVAKEPARPERLSIDGRGNVAAAEVDATPPPPNYQPKHLED